MRIGFIVNPIAGMGGLVGLKGTDEYLYEEALRRGAKPVSPSRATRFLKRLEKLEFTGMIVSANGPMGCDYLGNTNLKYSCIEVPPPSKSRTTRNDTLDAVKRLIDEGVELIVFTGGDGTARDIYDVVDGKVPIIGIPAGVKMYSGVFAISPEACAEVVHAYLLGNAEVDVGEVADADERAIQKGVLRVKVYGLAKTPVLEGYVTPTKDFAHVGGREEKEGIAEYFIQEYLKDNVLYLLGPGTTIKAITDLLGLKKTLLGVDALHNRRIVAYDIGEKEILNLLARYREAYVVVTVIGAQGYVFGRGNQQFSPRVLSRLGKDKLIIVATKSKLMKLRYLLVDTGDPELDRKFSGYARVITGYMEETVVPVVPSSDPEKIKYFSRRL